MIYRGRIYYDAEQKAEMWDRWQRGEIDHTIHSLDFCRGRRSPGRHAISKPCRIE